jgi:flagellar motor switch protein FliN/FliY
MSSEPAMTRKLGFLRDVQLPVTIRFGRADLTLRQALQLRDGSVIELDAPADAPVEILVNGHPIARGEVVAVNGNWAVRIQEILPGTGSVL